MGLALLWRSGVLFYTTSPGVTSDAPSIPSGTTLLDEPGSGQWSSDTFGTPDNWRIDYSYDCSSFAGGTGNFIVTAHNGN